MCTACYIYDVPNQFDDRTDQGTGHGSHHLGDRTIVGAARVLELLGPSGGGIRAHVAELTRRLQAIGWTVAVAGPAHVMEGVGQQDAVVAVPTRWSPFALRRARAQLSALLDTSPTEVLHAHGLKAALVALGVHPRPPLVLTVHNLVGGTSAGPRAHVLGVSERRILRRVDHVVVISDEIAAHLSDLVPAEQQTFVLPVSPLRHADRSPAEVRDQYGVGPDQPLVVVVARHHPQKDLGMFLQAMARVRDALPTVRALIVGDGPERTALEAECAGLGLGHTVTFAGYRPNPADEMQAADVVALSSRWEGSPLVVAECLALGRPLVTTAVGTVTRHLVDRVSARIVPVGDHDAFATALVDLLRHPERAAALGAAGRAVAADTFDPDRLTQALAQVYRHAAGTAIAG